MNNEANVTVIRDGKRMTVKLADLSDLAPLTEGRTTNGLVIVHGTGELQAGDLIEVKVVVESDGKRTGKLTALRLFEEIPVAPFDGSVKLGTKLERAFS